MSHWLNSKLCLWIYSSGRTPYLANFQHHPVPIINNYILRKELMFLVEI